MPTLKGLGVLALGVLAVACGGGGRGANDGTEPIPGGEAAFACSFVGGGSATISSGCLYCRQGAISSPNSAIDTDLGTAATVSTYHPDDTGNQQTVITITATAQEGIVFPSGSRAGVAMRLPTGIASYAVTINTFLNELPQESHQATPNPSPDGELVYYGFDMGTASTFDAVQLVLSESQPNLEEHEYDVIEFCSDGALK